jgi:hypothetical protein
MTWTTIYITGKKDFKEEVEHNVRHSDVDVMPGSAGNDSEILLYWLDERTSLRDLKKAIGSKTVFKYRLKFFDNLEAIEHANKDDLTLTPREEAMIKEMHRWQQDHKKSA